MSNSLMDYVNSNLAPCRIETTTSTHPDNRAVGSRIYIVTTACTEAELVAAVVDPR